MLYHLTPEREGQARRACEGRRRPSVISPDLFENDSLSSYAFYCIRQGPRSSSSAHIPAARVRLTRALKRIINAPVLSGNFPWRMNKVADRRAWIKLWPLYISVLILAAALVVGYLSFFSPVTTIFVVRHAEKSAQPPENPALSAAGQARSQELVRILEGANIRAVYATQFARTQQTVQPLATQLGLPVTQIDASDADGLINHIMSNHRGETVLVAGHSNTVPVIIEKLKGGQIPPIADTEYDKLFVVTVYRFGKAKVVQLRYGNPG
jgi:phosphohistidine phosphatase SixA